MSAWLGMLTTVDVGELVLHCCAELHAHVHGVAVEEGAGLDQGRGSQ